MTGFFKIKALSDYNIITHEFESKHDLIINVDKLGVEKTTEYIVNFVNKYTKPCDFFAENRRGIKNASEKCIPFCLAKEDGVM